MAGFEAQRQPTVTLIGLMVNNSSFAPFSGWMNKCFSIRAALLQFLVPLMVVSGPLQAAPPQAMPAWALGQATEANQASDLAVSRKEQVLLWTGQGKARAAKTAYLVVDAPFASVQPAVQQALGTLGQFESNRSDDLLAIQFDGWDEVLLSRRPDLREALAARFVSPWLELARQQGLITAAELDLRVAQARARIASVPQNRRELDAFKVTYARYVAVQDKTYGLMGRGHSALHVSVFDLSATFSQPTTAVLVSRLDEAPNPDYGVLSELHDFNILGGAHTYPTLTGRVVPAAAFNTVRAALIAVSSSDRIQIAQNPAVWVAKVEPPIAAPAISLAVPRTDRAPLDAELLPWSEVAGLSDDVTTYLHDLLTLPNGDVLISAKDFRKARVWRLGQVEGAWKSELVWQDSEGARRLALSADGHTVWFDGSRPDDHQVALVSYDVQTHQTRAFTVNLLDTDGISEYALSRWELTGTQTPALFDHSLLPKGASSLGRAVFQVLQPVTPPSPLGGAWEFKVTVNALRQSMMNGMKGNTEIWPVRWRGQKSLWVEDQTGIAELDVPSGRVLRAYRVPQRFGEINSVDASGVAQWVTVPLGSPQADWIALGFVLKLPDSGNLPPKLDALGVKQHFVGMHVINVKDGHVCLSALLGRADELRAAARSSNGQLLALGSDGVSADANGTAALWDAKACQPSLRLAVPARAGSLRALAFSWNGADLWCLTRKGLLHWRLPDDLRDAARIGGMPDQSHN